MQLAARTFTFGSVAELRIAFAVVVLAIARDQPASQSLDEFETNDFERKGRELEAAEPRISGVFELRLTTRACRFRQKDADAGSSTGG